MLTRYISNYAERRDDAMSPVVASVNEDEPNRKKGMVLPFEPFAITFEDIRYAVDMPQVSSKY